MFTQALLLYTWLSGCVDGDSCVARWWKLAWVQCYNDYHYGYIFQTIHSYALILSYSCGRGKKTPNALVEKEYPIILSIGIKWNIIFYVFLQSSVFLMNTSVFRLIASLVLSVTIFWKSHRVFPRKQLQQLREVHSMRPGRGTTVCLIDGNMKMPLWIESIYVIIPLQQNMFNDTKWPF